MKIIFICLLNVLLLNVVSCQPAKNTSIPEKTRVGVFQGNGGSPGCIVDAVEALKIDGDFDVSLVTANDILNGKLNELKALVIPGGSGSQQFSNLGDMGISRIKQAVEKDGMGIVGLCAGSYILSDTEGYACFQLSCLKAIDREHDARGHGTVAFKITEDGAGIFPELKELETSYIHYYEGPVLEPSEKSSNNEHILATMLSDVALQNDAPSGMTVNRPFFVNGSTGNGKYFMSVGHPENTPGMRWILPRMVRWTLGMALKSYHNNVVRPGIYSSEILFDTQLKQTEDQYFDDLIYGTPEQKITAINGLVAIKSWSARNHLPGLLRDGHSDVRLAAAQALLELERTEVIPDLGIIIRLEKDPSVREKLDTILKQLKAMIGQ